MFRPCKRFGADEFFGCSDGMGDTEWEVGFGWVESTDDVVEHGAFAVHGWRGFFDLDGGWTVLVSGSDVME